MKFTLTIPVSINSLYKQGRHGWYKDQKAVDWQEKTLWEIKIQRKDQKLPKGHSVFIVWHRANKRKYDIDGGIKLLLDTIVKAGIIKDDNLITYLQVDKLKDDKNYCEVEIL